MNRICGKFRNNMSADIPRMSSIRSDLQPPNFIVNDNTKNT